LPPLTSFLSTPYLRENYGNPNYLEGIRYNQAVGLRFQKDVLAHLPGPRAEWLRRQGFNSTWHDTQTCGRFSFVIPDGVAGAVEGFHGPLPPIITTYPESTFIEVKAVKGTLNLSYAKWQLAGMFDALAHSPASSSTGPDRAYPSLYLIVTGDTAVSTEISEFAAQRLVLVWLSGVEDLGGKLRVTPPQCVNCLGILKEKQMPAPLFGPTFKLDDLGGPGMGGLDEPMLDDQLIGYPGKPGPTSPNP